MNPLGIHFIPTHTGAHHYQFMRDMQPGINKIVGSTTPDVQQIAVAFAAAPKALMYLRNVARSEQHDFLWRDPVGAARQHVAEWHADLQERQQQAHERGLRFPSIYQIRILGVNEPVIELFPRQEDMSNYSEWLAMMRERTPLLDAYMFEFGTQAKHFGYGAGLGNLPSGQPANLKPGDYATFDWFPRTRALLEKTRGLNAYACHEYWRAETGPEGHADWHAWRFMHLNVDCDIVILECGVDQAITTEPYNGNRGWVGHMTAAAYVDQHRRYIARARADSRFQGETPFSLDGDKMWESFWIEYCMAEMVALSNELRAQPEPVQPTTTVYLPAVGNGATVVQPPVPAPVSTSSGIPNVPNMLSVLAVESNGAPFTDGLLTIRFEVHWFKVELRNDALFDRHFRFVPGNYSEQYWRTSPDAPWQHAHGSMRDRHALLDFARSLNDTAALRSTGMGIGQVMAFNHARIGFATPQAMFGAFSNAALGQEAQVLGAINYILSDKELRAAVNDWNPYVIATKYNGEGQQAIYVPRLNAARQRLAGAA